MDLSQLILNEFEKHRHKGLLVMSKGIGVLGILHQFITRYAGYSSLTLIINLDKDDSLFYRQNFAKEMQFEFALHNHEYETPQKRSKSYLKGGVVFTTSQLVTLDLLTRTLPADIINNVLVFQGENYYYNSTNFLLRMCKEQSNNHSKPERLLLVCEKFDRLLENYANILTETFTENVMLWPYFRLEVKNDLEAQEKPVLVSECEVEFDGFEKQIQRSILQTLAYMQNKFQKKYGLNIKEIRRSDLMFVEEDIRTLAEDYFHIEALLHKICERPLCDVFIYLLDIIDRLNDEFVNFMSGDTELDDILAKLENDFLHLVSIQKEPKVFSADLISRFVPEVKDTNEVTFNKKLSLSFSTPKKYKSLLAILSKIKEDVHELQKSPANVLVQFSSTMKASTVAQFLVAHYQNKELETYLLLCRLRCVLNSKKFLSNKNFSKNKREMYILLKLLDTYLKELIGSDLSQTLLLVQELEVEEYLIDEEKEAAEDSNQDQAADGETTIDAAPPNPVEEESRLNETSKISNGSRIPKLSDTVAEFRALKKIKTDPVDLHQLFAILSSLIEIKMDDRDINLPDPSFADKTHVYPVEMVNEFAELPELSVICQSFDRKPTFRNKYTFLDIYRPDFVVFYDIDVEYERELMRMDKIYPSCPCKPKQIYNLFIRNSVQSDLIYERIRRENSNFDQIIDKFAKLPKYFGSVKDLVREKGKGVILVDKREFNSRLPFRLYLLGIEIVPIMLEVADYILSNNIGIERKDCKTGDLINSIKSGRLERQIKSLLKKFRRAILLLENYQSCDTGSVVELYKLISRNKGLSILWAVDEGQTAKIFMNLKSGEPEPMVEQFARSKDKTVFGK